MSVKFGVFIARLLASVLSGSLPPRSLFFAMHAIPLVTALLALASHVAAGSMIDPRHIVDARLGPLRPRVPDPTCSPGQYYNRDTKVCTSCPPGNACPGDAQPKQCQKGTYATGGAAACTDCDPGTYAGVNAATSCTPAQCGYYSKGPNDGRGDFEQHKCGKGKYSGPRASECIDCPKGSYCPDDTTCTPTMCGPGQYAPDNGADKCKDCPAGTFINKSGASACCDCCAGSYNKDPGATFCTACPGTSLLVTSDPGSKNVNKCHAYNLGDPVPIPSVCTSSTVTANQPICPATTGTLPSGAVTRKRHVRKSCAERGYTMCEVKTGRGGFECIDTQSTLDACGSCDNDCSAIEHVGDVKCVRGKCQVTSCRKGYAVKYVDNKPTCAPTLKRDF